MSIIWIVGADKDSLTGEQIGSLEIEEILLEDLPRNLISRGVPDVFVFTKDKKLADTIVDSGEKTFERCWAMPMPEDYKTLLKSEFADINNMSSTRWGGAITAALFLSEFVKDTRWAHIDIAGPAYSKKAGDYCGAGGTGFGVRLLMDVLNKL